MQGRALAMVAAGILGIHVAAVGSAAAQDTPEAPPGYTDCGWRDFTYGGWTDEPETGVYFWVLARDLGCKSARRNAWSKVKYDSRGKPKLAGWKCASLGSGHEYSSVRCKKRGSNATFRFETGA